MDFNIEIRKKQLENLDQFVTCSKNNLQSILNCLGWSIDKLEEERLFETCPYNMGHKVPADKIEEHVEKCKVKSAGYELNEIFLSEPLNASETSSIKLDTVKKIEVLSQALTQTPFFKTAWNGQDPDPQTYDRLMTTFSKDERLALYNYCILNTKGPPVPSEFDISLMPKDKDDSFTEEKMQSLERDLKRRSVKYKPIHTNKKNHKEVLRELIASQMEQYKDWLISKSSLKGPHTPESSNDDEEKSHNREENHFKNSVVRSHSPSSHGSEKESKYKLKHFEEYMKHHSYEKKRTSQYQEDITSTHSSEVNTNEIQDDSQESHSTSQMSRSIRSENMYSSYEHYDDVSRAHSRCSSSHSSQMRREMDDKYKENGQEGSERCDSRNSSFECETKMERRDRSRQKSRERKIRLERSKRYESSRHSSREYKSRKKDVPRSHKSRSRRSEEQNSYYETHHKRYYDMN